MKKRISHRDYPRTARLNTLLLQIIAEEVERIDDERLERTSITSVVVDADLGRAVVYYDHSEESDQGAEAIAQAFVELRGRLQKAVARQTTIKRTPELRFEVDGVLRSAARIEDVLRGLQNEPPVPPLGAD